MTEQDWITLKTLLRGNIDYWETHRYTRFSQGKDESAVIETYLDAYKSVLSSMEFIEHGGAVKKK